MSRLAERLPMLAALALFAPPGFADTLPEIVERGTIRIGVSEFHPWTYGNEQGELEGFEIEVARRLTAAMGVEPEFAVYVWDEIIDAIEANEIDMIAAGMAITPFRAARVDFSEPYSESGITIVVNRAVITDPVANIKDLDDPTFTIALVDATLSGEAAQLFFDSARLESFSSADEAEVAVLAGAVPAYMTSAPEANILVAEHPDRLALPLGEPLPGSPAGFAVQPGNDSLLDFLNEWIADDDVQQWLEATYADWFIETGN